MATIKIRNTKVANKLINYAEGRAVEREGVDCSPEYAKSQFATTRELYGKTSGVQAHHVIQSFKPGEVFPGQANGIGVDLAKEIAKGHECVVYTHADKDHIHNHIVINAVNFENGKKYQIKKKDLYKIREISDKHCKERELSVIKEPTAKIRYTQAEQGIIERGKTSWKDTIREAIDQEKNSSKNYEDFKNNLKQKHSIEFNDKRKYITYKLDGQKRAVRGKTLGMDYERSTIEHGFERQIEGYTKREPARRIVAGNKEPQQAHGELHTSTYERRHGNINVSGTRVNEDRIFEQEDPNGVNFDIGKAKRISERLRNKSNKSFSEWQNGNSREQSDDIGKDGRDRDDSRKQPKQSRTRGKGFSR